MQLDLGSWGFVGNPTLRSGGGDAGGGKGGKNGRIYSSVPLFKRKKREEDETPKSAVTELLPLSLRNYRRMERGEGLKAVLYTSFSSRKRNKRKKKEISFLPLVDGEKRKKGGEYRATLFPLGHLRSL